jgi:hypothetical protein
MSDKAHCSTRPTQRAKPSPAPKSLRAELLQADIVANDDPIFDSKAAARIRGPSPRTLERYGRQGKAPLASCLPELRSAALAIPRRRS